MIEINADGTVPIIWDIEIVEVNYVVRNGFKYNLVKTPFGYTLIKLQKDKFNIWTHVNSAGIDTENLGQARKDSEAIINENLL